jgi:hypothetical protein
MSFFPYLIQALTAVSRIDNRWAFYAIAVVTGAFLILALMAMICIMPQGLGAA